MLTPRRVGGFQSTSGRPSVGFDHAISGGGRNPFTNTEAVGGFGTESFNSAQARNATFGTSSLSAAAAAASSKKSQPTSLLDASRRSVTGGLNDSGSLASPPGPSARILRSGPTGGASNVPIQSLRDSPFMRHTGPTASTNTHTNTIRNTNETPSASQQQQQASSSSSTLRATPFESDASPIRPLTKTNDEEKSIDTPAANRLFAHPPHTPFDSPQDGAWPNGVISTPGVGASSSSSIIAVSHPVQQTGLGFGPRNPCAVTIFGFAPSQAARVLSRFYAFGEVIAREDAQVDSFASSSGLHSSSTFSSSSSSSQPNWTHLLYRTPVAASMALAQNGRIIEGCMIGVKPRTDQSSEIATASGVGVGGRLQTGFHTPATDRTGSIFDRSARKLAQTPGGAGVSSSSSSSSMPPMEIYAKKSQQSTSTSSVHKSFCTKLMEYLFNY